eukprot:5948980-Amphidinium_carterae.2
MWSPAAAHYFRSTLDESIERYKFWERLPVDEKLAFEQKYVYGIRSLPPVENLLEGHMRYKEPFPNKVHFRFQMLEEIHTMPSDNQAANILDTWIQKIEVAKNYEVALEPQKLIAIVNKLVEMFRGADGNIDRVFSLDCHMQMMNVHLHERENWRGYC